MSSAPVLIGLLLFGMIAIGIVLLFKDKWYYKCIGALVSILGFILGIQFTNLLYLGASNSEVADLLTSWLAISIRFFVFAISVSLIWLMLYLFSLQFERRRAKREGLDEAEDEY